MPDGFELQALLTPIAGQSLVGADLREDFGPQSIYYRLRDARAEARAAERASDATGGDDPPPPQWRTVRDLAKSALQNTTKDLEIAAWYLEALVRSDGLDGIAAGAQLIDGFAGGFWDSGLYPLPDEDGIATRVGPITGLNGEGADGTLIQPLRKIELCRQPSGEPLYFYQYEDAAKVAAISDASRRQGRIAAGSLVYEDVQKWARIAGHIHFAALRKSLNGALSAWVAMAGTLDAKAGQDSPPTSRVRDMLGDIDSVIRQYAPVGVEAEQEIKTKEAARNDGDSQIMDALAPVGSARVVNREDMLRDLARIADWFRKAEPHSPMAFTLDDAVRRGRLGWPELLAELVNDIDARNAILSKLGILPPVEQ